MSSNDPDAHLHTDAGPSGTAGLISRLRNSLTSDERGRSRQGVKDDDHISSTSSSRRFPLSLLDRKAHSRSRSRDEQSDSDTGPETTAPIDAAPALAGPQMEATTSPVAQHEAPTRPPPMPGLEQTLSNLSVCTLQESLTGQQNLPDVPVSYRVPSPLQAMYDTHTGASSGWRSLGRMAEGMMHPFGGGGSAGAHTQAKEMSDADEHEESEKRDTKLTPANLRWWAGKLQLDGMTSLMGMSIAGDGDESGSKEQSLAADSLPKATTTQPVSAAELVPTIGPRHRHARHFFSHLKNGRNVVLLGGYRGSVLRDAKTDAMLWIPLKVGASIRRPTLELGLTPCAEETSTDLIYADGVLSRVGRLVDMNGRLQSKCKRKGARVHSWGYDWRLSLSKASADLQEFLQKLYEESSEYPSQRQGAIVIAHSMGGLVALHALSQTSNPKSFHTLSFASTPFLGTPNILGPLAWGDATLFNATICSPRSTFSFRSTFYLLPRDGRCFEEIQDEVDEAQGATERKVDFLELDTWMWAGLSPVVKGTKKWQEARSTKDVHAQAQEETERSEVAQRPAELPGAAPMGGIEMGDVTADDEQASVVLADDVVNTTNDGPTDCNDDDEVWTYLKRTLAEVRQFDSEITSGFSQDRFDAGEYPPITMVTSGRTPTTRGALAGFATSTEPEPSGWQSTVSASDYSKMVFGRGDGVVTLRSATSVPGSWTKCLVKDDPDEGSQAWITETSHRHVAILSDVDSIGRALWIAERAVERRRGAI